MVPADYGKLELVNTVGAILAMLYGLMVENGYSRVFFQNKDMDWRKSLYFTGQAFNVFCCILFGGLSFLYSDQIARVIFNFDGGGEFLRLITVVTLFKVLTHIPFNNIRNRERASLFIALNFGYLLATVLFTIYFLVIAGIGVKGVLYAQILAGVLELIALYYFTWDQRSLRFSMKGLTTMLGFSVFLIPSNLSSFVLNYSNRYFLNEYMNLEEVGLYSLGAKLAGVIPFLFTEPVKKAFGPHIYNMIDDTAKCKQQLADFSRVFFFLLAVVALLISLFSKEVVSIMAESSYSGSHSIVFILALSYLLLGLAGVIVIGIHITMKTWIITLIWPLSAAVNILANIIFIPKYGRYGAAVATLISVAFINISYFIAVHKVYRVNFAYGKLLLCLVLMVIMNFAGVYANLLIMPIAVLLKLGLILLFGLIIMKSGYFTDREMSTGKQQMLSMLKKLLSYFNKNR